MYVDEEKRFPVLVGRLLGVNGTKINAINAGVSGNDSLHSVNIFLNKIMPLKPNIAVLMHNINDLTVLLHEGTYWNQNRYRSALVTEDRSIKSFIKSNFPNTYNLAYNLRIKLLGETREFPNSDSRKPSIDSKNILKLFRANLNIFINIAKTKNITPVLMTQANRFIAKPDEIILNNLRPLKSLGMTYDEYRTLYLSMNDTVRNVASENNVLLIDLANTVPQTKQYMTDPVHFNNAGSELAAKIIAKRLEPLIEK